MTSHNNPPLNKFDMVKHDPCILKIFLLIYASQDQPLVVGPCVNILNKYIYSPLPKEDIILNEIIS